MDDAASVEKELISLTQRLLDAIAGRKWATYDALTDPSITCFEPEAPHQLIEGPAFHRFYLSQQPPKAGLTTTIVRPHVRICGDTAVVAYVRLIQSTADDGHTSVQAFAETRIWNRASGTWKQVHFHRS